MTEKSVETVRRVRALLPEIERQAPPGVTVAVLNDRSEFIRDSIHEVNFTLALAIVLVVLVILLFLRNLSSTLITALVLPTSVLGTFPVAVVGGEVTLKRLYRERDRIRLQPANPRLKARTYPSASVKIRGVVRGVIRRT